MGSCKQREETSLHIDCKRCLLDHYARHLCSWRLQKRIALRAKHIPGCVNTITDRESTAKLDSFDWHLNPKYFQLVITKLVQSTIDLFASRTNHQLPSFVITNPTWGRGDRSPDSSMGETSGLCLPHSLPSQMPKKGNSRESNNNPGMPSLANSVMVCTTPPVGGGHTHSPFHNIRALNRPSGSGATTGAV